MMKTNTIHSGGDNLLCILSSTVVGFVLTIVLLFIASVISVAACPSDAVAELIVAAVTYVSVGFCGFKAARGVGRSGLISGAASGFIYAFVLYLIGGIFMGDLAVSVGFVINAAVCIISGAAGGLIGINTRRRKRR